MAPVPSIRREPTAATAGPPPLLRTMRVPVMLGLTVIFVFFFGFGAWASLAPLASAAIAPGVVSPDGSRKVIQHLEGGIIREILVRAGDRVEAGEPLMVLEDTQARAQFDMVRSQYMMLTATEARLLSEQAERSAVDFPSWLTREGHDAAGVRAILDSQVDLFETRRNALESSRAILSQRIAQLDEEIVGLEAQIASQTTQLALIEEEIVDVSELLRKGLERRPRLLALQRTQAEIEGQRAANRARIARARQTIGETELQIINLDVERLDEIGNQMAEVRGQMSELEERVRSSEDVLFRTTITAPVAGTIVEINFKTPGGVVGPGEPIMDLVPEGDDLLIDARVAPTDIDVVHRGLEAQVHMLAYAQRNLPRIRGTVEHVSADSLLDEQTGESYFLARVKVDRDELQELAPDIELAPGMPAEVLIMIGERTVLQYLMEPFTDTLRRSFKET